MNQVYIKADIHLMINLRMPLTSLEKYTIENIDKENGVYILLETEFKPEIDSVVPAEKLDDYVLNYLIDRLNFYYGGEYNGKQQSVKNDDVL